MNAKKKAEFLRNGDLIKFGGPDPLDGAAWSNLAAFIEMLNPEVETLYAPYAATTYKIETPDVQFGQFIKAHWLTFEKVWIGEFLNFSSGRPTFKKLAYIHFVQRCSIAATEEIT